MLTLYANNMAYPIKNDDYYIRQVDTGRDELIFNISIWDELYPLIVEEASIQDRDQMHYLVKAIDAGADTAKVRCEIDLDEWRATLDPEYTNGSATCLATIQGVCPGNWTVRDQSGVTFSRTIEGAYTPLDVAEACKETYGITLRWDNKNRVVTIINPANYQPLGAFVTRDLNLKELNYKGSSSDFITRLYAYGKDGLSFASINNGLPYVDDNTYSSRVICGYWTDNRYEIAENLLADAKTKLASLAIPSRSYTCSVYDLAKTNPEMYGFEDFSLFSVVKLIDDSRGTAINHQVVEYWDYPHYPEKNDVVLSTSPARIQSQITQIGQQIENPNSSFNQQQANAIANATNQITGINGGYVVINKNAQNQPYEILIMDTPDIATATKVWRWNNGGLGYSSSGYNGPYKTAMTQDGAFVADFITSGTLNASVITAGILQSANGNTSINLDTGNASIYGTLQTAAVTINGHSANTLVSGNSILFFWDGDQAGKIYLADDSGSPFVFIDVDQVNLKNINFKNSNGDVLFTLGEYNEGLSISNLATIFIQNSGGNVAWKTVNLADGGTAQALCLE